MTEDQSTAPGGACRSEGAITRRRAIAMMGLAAAAGCTGLAGAAAPDESPAPRAGNKGPGDDGALDDALRLMQRQEPRCTQGLSTHAPMVAEALCALGYADRAVAWVLSYDAPVLTLPAPSARIEAARWREALGPRLGLDSWEETNARWGDWREFFTVELGGRRWQEVLDTWIGRLAPGMSGAATHGVIRTAHAVRALARRETPERRAELARALAYWASSYEELPARPGSRARFEAFADALAEVPLYWQAFGKSPDGRNIVEQLRHVRELRRFAEVRDMVAQPADLARALSALTATFARVYLRHGTRLHTLGFVHAVTGPASLRRMAPHLSPETARAALPCAWQTAAALYSAFARERGVGSAEESRLAPDELAARAVKNGDEHAIKLTEVMLAEHRINPDPIYLAAAEDVIQRLRPQRRDL